LVLKPRQLFCHPHAPLLRHFKFEKKTALLGVADAAFELAELAEISRQAVADLADYGNVNQHSKRRHARRAAREISELAAVIVTIVQAVAAANGDAHRTLPEESFERHARLTDAV